MANDKQFGYYEGANKANYQTNPLLKFPNEITDLNLMFLQKQ